MDKLSRFRRPTTGYCQLFARDEPLTSRSQPKPRTPVDIRWERASEVSLCLTFRHARRDLPLAKLDPQVTSCKANQTDTWSSRGSRTPCGTPNPKSLISKFAYCSPDEDEFPVP
jgi:hypothetical protein